MNWTYPHGLRQASRSKVRQDVEFLKQELESLETRAAALRAEQKLKFSFDREQALGALFVRINRTRRELGHAIADLED